MLSDKGTQITGDAYFENISSGPKTQNHACKQLSLPLRNLGVNKLRTALIIFTLDFLISLIAFTCVRYPIYFRLPIFDYRCLSPPPLFSLALLIVLRKHAIALKACSAKVPGAATRPRPPC